MQKLIEKDNSTILIKSFRMNPSSPRRDLKGVNKFYRNLGKNNTTFDQVDVMQYRSKNALQEFRQK